MNNYCMITPSSDAAASLPNPRRTHCESLPRSLARGKTLKGSTGFSFDAVIRREFDTQWGCWATLLQSNIRTIGSTRPDNHEHSFNHLRKTDGGNFARYFRPTKGEVNTALVYLQVTRLGAPLLHRGLRNRAKKTQMVGKEVLRTCLPT